MTTTSRKRIPRETREMVYKKFEGHCAYCGTPINRLEMQVDHVTALHRGGTNDLSNLMPACRPCNYYKGTMTIEEFREELGKLTWRLERTSFIYRMAESYCRFIRNVAPIKFYFEIKEKIKNEAEQKGTR